MSTTGSPGDSDPNKNRTVDFPDTSGADLLKDFVESRDSNRHPHRVGPWILREVLGEGGMGSVYLAEQLEPVRRRVALKLIKIGMDTCEVIARFERERQALALMDHPNIARVLDAGSAEDGRPYFVMELVRGIPLTDYCDKNKLQLKDRLALFEQVCHGVQHAHHKGIIHRDIKPSNILVTSSSEAPVAKIIDFGVARATQQLAVERTAYTELGQMIGTPAYMSPEQAEMSSEDVDTRSDVYSLGVVLYELLAGVLPVDPAVLRKGGWDEMRRMIREVEPLPPSTRVGQLKRTPTPVAGQRGTTVNVLAREIRGDLDWITMKAMEKDRTRRYGTASELAADVRRYLSTEPILAHRPSATYRLSKFVRKHRFAFGASIAAMFLMVAVVAAAWAAADRFRLEQDRERSRSLLTESKRIWAERQDRMVALAGIKEQFSKFSEPKDGVFPSAKPVWECDTELKLSDEIVQIPKLADELRAKMERTLAAAIEAAPPESEEKRVAARFLEDVYWKLYGQVPSDGQARKVVINSEPGGALVYCFRYQFSEGRLVPTTVASVAGAKTREAEPGGAGGLAIRAVDDSSSPFRKGDRLQEVAGKPMRTFGDLARALSGLAPDASVDINISRGGESVKAAWIPFPSSRYAPTGPLKSPWTAGRLVHLRMQLGLDFDAYPLDASEACLLGKTAPGQAVEAELAPGSYLLLVRKDGYLDARIPIALPGFGDPPIVRLRKPAEVPPGFIQISAGPAALGGDPEAFQGMESTTAQVPEVFLSRLELTSGEYLEFVNDPEVAARTDDEGMAVPTVKATVEELRTAAGKDPRISLIPRSVKSMEGKVHQTIWDRTNGNWMLSASWKPSRPMLSVSNYAALEYAAWRTQRERSHWIYRLPTDMEWEKAARGVDRRKHVWGDILLWSLCWSRRGRPGTDGILNVDMSPFDESIYGIRDLAGSASEHTSSRPLTGIRLNTTRGGNWLSIDAQEFHAAARSTTDPNVAQNYAGIRLAAELKD